MASPLISSHPQPRIRHSRRGIALLLVLACLVLLSILVIAFLNSVKTDVQSSKSYSDDNATRMLADTAVNVVMSQIRQATTTGANPASPQLTAWASQPGMIRTFDTNGNTVSVFKLYSSSQMVANGTGFLSNELAAATGTGNWYSYPALYTDLNQPVVTAAGTIYPILTPPVPALSSGTIDGYQIAPAGTTGTDTPVATGANPNPVPMPAQWLYVLQSGSLVAPTAISGSSVTISGATSANPIVGRIAFWTDDETCKININTAGGNGLYEDQSVPSTTPINYYTAGETFWDVPHFTSQTEVDLAETQPANEEYQRYPGHPGTVELWGILGDLGVLTSSLPQTQLWPTSSSTWPGPLATPPPSASNPPAMPAPPAAALLASGSFFQMLPRYIFGGSQGATFNINTAWTANSAASGQLPNTISIKSDRLYTTVDEFLLSATNVITTGSGVSRIAQGGLTPSLLSEARFFLTAHSRAPELNLFGMPRVSMWPITVTSTGNIALTQSQPVYPDTTHITAVDQLLSFDSTVMTGTTGSITPSPYYFIRQNSGSTNTDINLTNGNGSQRNLQLLGYLDYLTAQAIPGYGVPGSSAIFDTKYTQLGMRQILTEMFDYIRMTNTEDGSLPGTIYPTNSQHPRNPNWYANDPASNQYAASQVVPSTHPNWGTQGIGTFPRLYEATLQFVGLGYNPAVNGTNPLLSATNNIPVPAFQMIKTVNPSANWTMGNALPAPPAGFTSGTNVIPGYWPTQGGNIAVQAFLFLSWIDPGQRYGLYGYPAFWVSVTGLNNFTLNGTNLGFSGGNPKAGSNTMMVGTNLGGGTYGSSAMAGYVPITAMTASGGQDDALNNTSSTAKSGVYPFYSQIIPVKFDVTTAGTQTMAFNGGTLTVTIYDVAGGSSSLSSPASSNVVQTLTLKFPQSTTVPIPGLTMWPIIGTSLVGGGGGTGTCVTGVDDALVSPTTITISTGTGVSGLMNVTRFSQPTASGTYPDRWYADGSANGYSYAYGYPIVDPSGQTGLPGIKGGTVSGVAAGPGVTTVTSGVASGDVMESMVLENGTGGPALSQGWQDIRTLALTGSLALNNVVPSTAFVPHPLYGSGTNAMAHNLTWGPNIPFPGNPMISGSLANLANFHASYCWYPNTSADAMNNSSNAYPWGSIPIAPPGINGVTTYNGAPGDWDNGISNYPDGPWVNKADEGNLPPINTSGTFVPYYYGGHGTNPTGPSYFSPNREVPSPGMFGSLPTGVDPRGQNPRPWQTLLFRPGTSGSSAYFSSVTPTNYAAHPGEANQPTSGCPADHVLLDLFWMPVAEPYAISDPFSTAGKVNMNYQIQPYTYICRSTALRAALAGEEVADNLSPSEAGAYKFNSNYILNGTSSGGVSYGYPTRAPINLDLTTQQFQYKFGTGDIFHSASDICDIYLIPNDINSYGNGTSGGAPGLFPTLWYNTVNNRGGIYDNFVLEGDNTRERPYTDLYGKLTTKSNTYQVHYRVQSLQKLKNSNQIVWTEGQDQVTGEKRGSTIIERYIDPTATGIPDFASVVYANASTPVSSLSLEPYYKFRIVNSTGFHP